MQIRARYTATTVGATSVTLNPTAGYEDEDKSGAPNLYGTGTIVITQGATPDANYWKQGQVYLFEISRVF